MADTAIQPMLVDSHCHLDFDVFDDDRDTIIQNAADIGMHRMVTICTRIRKFEQVHAIAMQYEPVYCSVGTHPHNAHEELDIGIDELVALASREKVVAIGEAGLDYFYQKEHAAAQAHGLRTHIAAARDTGLPLVIHSRDADDDMIAILEDEMAKGTFPALLHCFSSGRELALRGVELGLYVSFSGILTFRNSEEIRSIAADLPAERLLVETDAPYLAPSPFRGKRNEPAFTKHTAEILAETRGVEYADIAAQTTENFFRLFSKVPRPESG